MPNLNKPVSSNDPTILTPRVSALETKTTNYPTDVNNLDALRADLYRTKFFSGVIDYVSTIKIGFDSSSTTNGQVQTPLLTNQFNINSFGLTPFNILINGYKSLIKGLNNQQGYFGTTYNQVTLNTAPTYGYREDLVFLEGWFPNTGGLLGNMNWRIRVVDGVDFVNYPIDGISKSDGTFNPQVWAQGGAAVPQDTTGNANNGFYNSISRSITGATSRKIFTDDVGLWMAGDGSSSSKTTLQTLDGYVYAIPLFRVKRRNSGGFRKDNLNGARDYFTMTIDTVTVATGGVAQWTVDATSYGKLLAGDTILYNGTTKVSVLSKDGSNKITVSPSAGFGTFTGLSFTLVSDRPDGLYSNIIDASDIIDLRHRIPVNFNPTGEVESAFDSLLRGALTTKDTKTSYKEVYGLRKAPLGLAQQLQSTTIKRADGTSVDLTNLLGVDGNFDTLNLVQNKTGYSTALVDSASAKFGNNGLKLFPVTSANSFSTPKTLTVGGYYLIGVWYKFDSADTDDTRLSIKNGSVLTYGGGDAATILDKTSTVWKFAYLKFSPTNSTVYVGFTRGGAVGAQTLRIDGMCLYQIDQTTYNLIDTDVNYTGGDKIGNLFPYVDSYPNFVENLCPTDTSSWTVGSINTVDGTDLTQLNRIRTGFISVKPSTVYTLTYDNNSSYQLYGFLEYDASGNFLLNNALNAYATNPKTLTTGANTYKVRTLLRKSDDSNIITDIVLQALPKIELGSIANPFVPTGRYYLDKDYLANAHLNNNVTTKYQFEGTGGSFNSQRLTFSDAMTSQTVVDVVEALMTPQKHVKVTQATAGTWASGDKIVISSDYGLLTGVVDSDTGMARLVQDSNNSTTLYVDDVSKFAVNDTIKILNNRTDISTTNIGDFTITAVDTTNKILTISSATGYLVMAGSMIVETTTATSSPSVAYTAQQNKTAQGGTSTSITLSADASSVTDYYKGLQVFTIGSGQVKTITAYNGSTKVATVDTTWSGGNPSTNTLYSILMPGTWTNLGTKSATFTVGTMPTAVDATLGNANQTNISLTYSVNYPAGKGMSNVPTDILKVEVNGQELLASNTVSVKANFVNKVSGNTDAVPHIFKSYWGTSLSTTPSTQGSEFSGEYPKIISQDGSSSPATTTTTGQISQHLFQFDIIRAIEDKYGEIPVDGLAAKIAWVKANISSVVINWNGYGSGPSGNSATVSWWSTSTNGWNSGGSTTSSSVALVSFSLSSSVINGTSNTIIDSNGYIFFLTYAPASDGVTSSTINTDYVELSITLNTAMKSAFDSNTETGFTVLQPTNPFPVLTENVLTANQAFPADLNTGDFISTSVNAFNSSTLTIDSLGILKCVTDGTVSSQGFGTVAVTTPNGYYSASVLVKGTAGQQISLVLRDSITAAPAWGSATTVTLTGDWQVAKINGLNCISGKASIAIATSGTLATTFYVKQLKINQGPTATDWSAGRKKKVTLNYLGKVAGSVVENPHRVFNRGTTTFESPDVITSVTTREYTQATYDSVTKQDGVLGIFSQITAGNYAIQLFEFDLSYLGMSLGELKKTVRGITATWIGYGSGDNAGVLTYGARVKFWNNSITTWESDGSGGVNTASTPSSVVQPTSFTSANAITNSQKVYVLVYNTYPASATNASTIYTDYIKLDVTLSDAVDYTKCNIIKIQPETKTIRTWFPAISRRYVSAPSNGAEDQIAFYSRYVPYQGLGSIAKSKILALGTPIITTLGTGSYPSDVDSTSIKAMSTRLPSPVADYNLIADKFTSEGVTTTMDGLTLKQNALIGGVNGYRLTPKVGSYFDTTSTTLETVIRGTTGRLTLSTDMITSVNGQGSYKFSIPTTLPSEALVSLPMLVVDSGELKMVIVSFRKSKSNVLQYYSTDGVYDQFKLAGRPLVKGV